jgi:hypothetical protein
MARPMEGQKDFSFSPESSRVDTFILPLPTV